MTDSKLDFLTVVDGDGRVVGVEGSEADARQLAESLHSADPFTLIFWTHPGVFGAVYADDPAGGCPGMIWASSAGTGSRWEDPDSDDSCESPLYDH